MKLKKPNLQIAIDGPVGAGKSIIANLLSKKFNILYVYTGAMYRGVAYLGLKNKIALENNEHELFMLLKKSKIELKPTDKNDRVCQVLINDQDVTEQLFTPEVSWGSSVVATYPQIRQELVNQQQKIASGQAVIMEGRDIAAKVLPQADLKIFMTADLEIRAKRRWEDLKKQNYQKSLDEVIKETQERDYQDSHRSADPLKIAPGAWMLDTSKLSIDQVTEVICNKLKEKDLIS